MTSCSATAAVLPRNTPAGSSPDRRRPSRAPSGASSAKLRCTASTLAKSTATQNRPGAACAIGARSGPSAKAKRTSTRTATGTTWCSTTRERARSAGPCPPRGRVSRHMDAPRNSSELLRRPGRRVAAHRRRARPRRRPPTRDTTRSASGQRLLGLVRSQEHGGAIGHHLGDDLSEHHPGTGVEPGVGLVEEPQLGTARHEHSQRHPAALAGREPTHRRAAQPASELEPIEHGVDARQARRRRARTAKRTFSTTVRSS